jgi:group I intron endonuclease
VRRGKNLSAFFMGVIYKITSPANRIYVGQAKNLKKRIAGHRLSAKRDYSSIILVNSFKKYGFNEHKIDVIEECDNDKLNEREIFWIQELKSFYMDSPLGMNMTTGGEGHTGFDKFDEERKKKVLQNLYKNGVNPFKGKYHTEENKKFLSEFMKERNKKNAIVIPYWGAVKGWQACMKDVVVYGKNGNRLGEFKSITAAADFFGFKNALFSDSIRLNRWVNGEYKVFYKKENMPEVIPTDDIRFQSVRKEILAFDRNMIFLGEFEYAEEASKILGVPATTIKRAAKYNNLHPIRKGFIFVYKEDYGSLNPSEMEGGIKK